eukprot:909375-Pelagomonas_calceolata.AAC.1
MPRSSPSPASAGSSQSSEALQVLADWISANYMGMGKSAADALPGGGSFACLCVFSRICRRAACVFGCFLHVCALPCKRVCMHACTSARACMCVCELLLPVHAVLLQSCGAAASRQQVATNSALRVT